MANSIKKAIVIGGSSGLGLAITKELCDNNYFVYVLSRHNPEKDILNDTKYKHIKFNLLDFNEDELDELINDDISMLIITSGIGKIASFKDHHIGDINKILNTNTLSIIKIIKLFYNKIIDSKEFKCGVVSSIAGILSSPLNSVYAASKAALYKFIESVNIELEVSGTSNRITNIVPGYFKGSKFDGDENDISLLKELAHDTIYNIINSKDKFIVNYKVYKNVIDNYINDYHKFGIDSYNYKLSSGRLNKNKTIIGYLSGTFDLFHIGHLNILKRAKVQCDYLIVGIYKDGKRKGKDTFIPLEERKQILLACKYVDSVVDALPEDSDAWDLYKYNKLFVGSDYKGSERFNKYEEYFNDKDVEIIYFPYTQTTSSSQLRQKIIEGDS